MSGQYIARYPYGFEAKTEQEAKQLKDFLGISPAGFDIDTYLGSRAKTQLGSWNNYWTGIWDGLGRKDLAAFTNNLYKKYAGKLAEPAAAEKKPAAAPPAITPIIAPVLTPASAANLLDLLKSGETNLNKYGLFGGIAKTFDDAVNATLNAAGLGFLAGPQITINADAIAKWIIFAPLMVTAASGSVSLPKENVLTGVTPALFLKKPAELVKWFNEQESVTQIALIGKWKTMTGGQQATSILLRDAVQRESKSWIAKALPWLGAAITLSGTVTFINFLFEESLQTIGMGVYVAISNKQYAAAKEALAKAKGTLEIADFFYNNFGWLAPYSWKVFKTYADATRAQYEVYDKVLYAQKGAVMDPSAAGKVFNAANFTANLTNAVSPPAAGLVAGEAAAAAPPATGKQKTTKEEFFKEMKTFYVGRMYLSKKELAEMMKKYDVTEIQNFIDEINSFYAGRMYLSRKELIPLGKKYNLDVSGL
jgi:hypothetical protein